MRYPRRSPTELIDLQTPHCITLQVENSIHIANASEIGLFIDAAISEIQLNTPILESDQTREIQPNYNEPLNTFGRPADVCLTWGVVVRQGI